MLPQMPCLGAGQIAWQCGYVGEDDVDCCGQKHVSESVDGGEGHCPKDRAVDGKHGLAIGDMASWKPLVVLLAR